MSRRKQPKPSQILNDAEEELNDESVDTCKPESNGMISERVGHRTVKDHMECHQTPRIPSENNTSILLSSVEEASVVSSSMLNDFSTLISQRNDAPQDLRKTKTENCGVASTDNTSKNFRYILRSTPNRIPRNDNISALRMVDRRRSCANEDGINETCIQQKKPTASGADNLSLRNGLEDSESAFHCHLCSKSFKQLWGLQIHERMYHNVQGDASVVTRALATSHKHLADAQRKAMENLPSRYSHEQRAAEKIHDIDKDLKPSSSQSPSPIAISEAEENNNETSQSSDAGSLTLDACLAEGLMSSALQHTPMFGGITIPSVASFQELRKQISLMRRTCKFCGKVCFKPSDLQRHLMKHTGERPFSCSQCGRRFKAKRSLHYHQRASHGAIIELSPALEDKFAQTKKYRRMVIQSNLTTQTDREVVQSDAIPIKSSHGQVMKNSRLLLMNGSAMQQHKVTTDDRQMDNKNIAHNRIAKSETSDDELDDLADSDLSDDNEETLTSGLSDSADMDSCSDEEILEVKESGKSKNRNSISGLTSKEQKKIDLFIHKDDSSAAIVVEEVADEEGDDENNCTPSSSGKLKSDACALKPTVPIDPEEDLSARINDKSCVNRILALGSTEEEVKKYETDRTSNESGCKIRWKSEQVIATRLEGVNTVTGEKVLHYKCFMCGKVFSFLNKLQRHLTVHMVRNTKRYSCSECGEVFRLHSQWVLHCRTHSPETLSVPYINQSSPSKQEMESEVPQDLRMNHSPDSPVNQLHNPYLHDNAGEMQAEEKFKGESRSITSDVSIMRFETGILSSQSNLTVLDPVALLNSNRSSDHGMMSQCQSSPEGDNVVSTSSANVSASSLSPGSDPIRCVSRGKHNYSCSYCGKLFDRPFSLQRHERMHTGVKPCYCHDCGRGFSEPRNLRHHIIRFHSDGSLQHLLRRNRCGGSTITSGKVESSDAISLNHFGMAGSRFSFRSQNSFIRNAVVKSEQLLSEDESLPPTLEEMVPLIPKSEDDDDAIFDLKKQCMLADVNLKSSKEFLPHSRTEVDMESIRTNADTDAVNTQGQAGKHLTEEEETVTIVIPTAVVDNMSLHSRPVLSNFWDQLRDKAADASNFVSHDSKEILTDPKRSLIGNRRKQRPVKVISNIICSDGNNLEDCIGANDLSMKVEDHNNHSLVINNCDLQHPTPKSQTSQVYENENANVPEEKMETDFSDMTEFVESLEAGAREARSRLNNALLMGRDHPRWQTKMTVASLLAKERGIEIIRPRRRRARGHSSVFSSYSPRLDVVNKPAERVEVCRPQVLNDGKNTFNCCYCNKTFLCVSDLNRHMDFHEGEMYDVRPFKCKYCEYSSRTNSQLKVHLMRHQGIKKFQCHLCSYTGVTRSDLNRHCKTQSHLAQHLSKCLEVPT